MNDNIKVHVRFRDEAGNIIQARAYEATQIPPGAQVALVGGAAVGIYFLLKASLVLLAL